MTCVSQIFPRSPDNAHSTVNDTTDQDTEQILVFVQRGRNKRLAGQLLLSVKPDGTKLDRCLTRLRFVKGETA